MDWYYAERKERKGPYSREEMLEFLREGTIQVDTLAWCTGQLNWQPFGDLNELLAVRNPPDPEPLAEGMVACPSCQSAVPEGSLIPTGGVEVCGHCKELYLQRVREGLPGDPNEQTGTPRPTTQLLEAGWEAMAGNWWRGVGANLLRWLPLLAFAMLGSAIPVPLLPNVLDVLLLGPLELGLATFFLECHRRRSAPLALVFHAYRSYGRAVGALALRSGALFLTALLLTLPVLWAAFATSGNLQFLNPVFHPSFRFLFILVPAGVGCTYLWLRWALVFYLLADNSAPGVLATFAESSRRLEGQKLRLLGLYLVFGFGGLVALVFSSVAVALAESWAWIPTLVLVGGTVAALTYLRSCVTVFYNDLVAWEAPGGGARAMAPASPRRV